MLGPLFRTLNYYHFLDCFRRRRRRHNFLGSYEFPRPQQVHQKQLTLHYLLSTSSANHGGQNSGGTAWERGAKMVKDTDVVNPYIERMRSEVVDPVLHLKTIEDELCGAIGKALGRQGEKVSFAIDKMKEMHTQYLECVQTQCYEQALQYAQLHNDLRKRAIQARWELLVHRQAVGFTVDNHRVVHNMFPISDALPICVDEIRRVNCPRGEDSSEAMQISSEHLSAKRTWGDQLSWWERVGRWK